MPPDPIPNGLEGCPVVITLPVLWGDQDAFGHVNNTAFIRWFESSRIAFLEQSGLGELMKGSQLRPILASIQCSYRRQLHYPDTVQVGARVHELRRSRITIEHLVYSHQLADVSAEGTSVIVIFDYENQRPVRIPSQIRDAVAGRETGGSEPAC